MLGLCTIFFLLSAVAYTDAAAVLIPPAEKPIEFADQEGCYLKDLNRVLPYGDYYPEKGCSKYTCYSTNTTQIVTCGVAVLSPGSPCRLISNEREKYPNCCPTIMCPTIPPEVTSKPTPVSDHQADAAPTDGHVDTDASSSHQAESLGQTESD